MWTLGEKRHTDPGANDVSPPSELPYSETSDAPIDPEDERRLVMKFDLIIFPVFFVIYVMAFLDRINISNASIQGLTEELQLNEGNRFNVVLFVCCLPLLSHLSCVRHCER